MAIRNGLFLPRLKILREFSTWYVLAKVKC